MAQRGFEQLVDEAQQADITGWDFSWLEGRATEDRPTWGYQQQLTRRLAAADSALDLDTGGGEVLAAAAPFPPTMAAAESWEPNLRRAMELLHPVAPQWKEIHRLLEPGGTYFAQHVGPQSVFELSEFFRGPLPAAAHRSRHPDVESADATAAGLEVVSIRRERTRIEIFEARKPAY